LGCCLANKPVLLLLDEPIAGIDKDNKKIIKDIILKLKNEEITILQIEHDMEFIEETSDLVFQLEDKGLKILEINNNC